MFVLAKSSYLKTDITYNKHVRCDNLIRGRAKRTDCEAQCMQEYIDWGGEQNGIVKLEPV